MVNIVSPIRNGLGKVFKLLTPKRSNSEAAKAPEQEKVQDDKSKENNDTAPIQPESLAKSDSLLDFISELKDVSDNLDNPKEAEADKHAPINIAPRQQHKFKLQCV